MCTWENRPPEYPKLARLPGTLYTTSCGGLLVPVWTCGQSTWTIWNHFDKKVECRDVNKWTNEKPNSIAKTTKNTNVLERNSFGTDIRRGSSSRSIKSIEGFHIMKKGTVQRICHNQREHARTIQVVLIISWHEREKKKEKKKEPINT